MSSQLCPRPARHQNINLNVELHGLCKLPDEMIEIVLRALSTDDILHVRRLNRRMDYTTWYWVSRRYFTITRVPLCLDGLIKVCRFITAEQDFRSNFTKLELDAGIHCHSEEDDRPPVTRKQRKQRRQLAHNAKCPSNALHKLVKEEEEEEEEEFVMEDAQPGVKRARSYHPYDNPDEFKPRKKYRGHPLPTSPLMNSDAHKGKVYGRRIINKCFELLPNIREINICHRVDGVEQRERAKWVSDHRMASAEAVALLNAPIANPKPLKRLTFGVTRFDRDRNEGLMLLANLANIPGQRILKLQPSFASLEHFSISLDTNTLDSVEDFAYDALPALLHLMPNLRSLELAFSKRNRRTHPTKQFRRLAECMPVLEKLETLRLFQGRIETDSFMRILRKSLSSLLRVDVVHLRIFDIFTPGQPNESADWPRIVERVQQELLLGVLDDGYMVTEHNDPGLMNKLLLFRMMGAQSVAE
ncbi:F-box domain cyclin-like protein [Macrophomina phaseolina MS6]|uniref:F-box domain cyclin-like protein n=1 Tax=Macrophomina phaseolina (strain MS6) TaxID=1126212 RepID=K2RAW5_MACPH|nr:F-box domain cyclin-like protein [Macrophomina phaseolina MS6]